MKRTSLLLSAFVLIALWVGAVCGEGLVISDEVAAIDNIPPAPVTELQALDASGEGGESIVVTWMLSIDDAVSATSSGNGLVPRGGVYGYRVYREAESETASLIATLSPGVSEYVDTQIESGGAYLYEVRSFDLDNETELKVIPGSVEDLARFVVVGGGAGVDIVATIKGQMRLDAELDLEDQGAVEAFTTRFVTDVAAALSISSDRVKVTGISAGSVVVEFEIVAPAEGVTEPTAADALVQLQSLVAEDPQVFADLGEVLELADESTTEIVRVTQPLDVDGAPILGWFTREGESVDFDDFFLFADHFGQSEGDAEYDSIFDIVATGTIDFDDFFRFADDFGKVVVNAADIRAQLGL
ncbi:MAG: hypothetical protein HOC74_14955 [Gemmatimonadetes bacterium]|nr:hypothetical protein [Gemmatimonadota bacterium]